VTERMPANTEIVAALSGWAAALTVGDRATALVAAQRAMALARSVDRPYAAVTAACVEHAGGTAAELFRQASPSSCSFCEATEDTARLVAGPGVFICEVCITSGRDQKVAQGGAGNATGRPCSFCNSRPSASAPAVATTNQSICAACLRICARILSGKDA
jgi:hypothetical protein